MELLWSGLLNHVAYMYLVLICFGMSRLVNCIFGRVKIWLLSLYEFDVYVLNKYDILYVYDVLYAYDVLYVYDVLCVYDVLYVYDVVYMYVDARCMPRGG